MVGVNFYAFCNYDGDMSEDYVIVFLLHFAFNNSTGVFFVIYIYGRKVKILLGGGDCTKDHIDHQEQGGSTG